MLAVPPDISSGIITTENGRFVLKGNPTPQDLKAFEEWCKEVEAVENEAEELQLN